MATVFPKLVFLGLYFSSFYAQVQLAPPTLEHNIDQDCGSGILCIPYAQCCTGAEFCNRNVRHCSSCFPHYLETNEMKFEFCKTAQFNMSQMMHPSCTSACDTVFGREAFTAEPDTGEPLWVVILLAVLLGVCLLIIICGVVKFIILPKRKKDKTSGEPQNINMEVLEDVNSKEEVNKEKKRTLQTAEAEQPVYVTMREGQDVHVPLPHMEQPHSPAEDEDIIPPDAGQNIPLLNQDSPQVQPSAPSMSTEHAHVEHPLSAEEDQSKNRRMHLPETDGHKPTGIITSGAEAPHRAGQYE